MTITFQELRKIKHSSPTGSVKRIAKELNIDQQTIRNYFGAKNFTEGQAAGWHLQPGPNGGYLNFKDMSILNLAIHIIENNSQSAATAA